MHSNRIENPPMFTYNLQHSMRSARGRVHVGVGNLSICVTLFDNFKDFVFVFNQSTVTNSVVTSLDLFGIFEQIDEMLIIDLDVADSAKGRKMGTKNETSASNVGI